ncbi:MAG: MFS transporter [Anaerolineae bacterium]|jgi:MFS family permease
MLLSRRQARLLLPLGSAMALSLAGDSTLYAVLPNQIEAAGISLAVVGVLLGANRLIRIPGNLLVGSFYDRSGRRRLFLLGLGLGVVSTFSYSLAHGFWALLAGRLLWGVAWALINVGGYTMILDYSTSSDRGRMAGFYQLVFMLGLAFSPVIGGLLTDALGFRPALRICAAVSAVGLAVALLFLPETRPLVTGPVQPQRPRWPVRRLRESVSAWRTVDRRILLASYIYLVTLFVNSGVLMSTISLYLGQRWGAGVALGGVVIGVASLGGLMLAMRALSGMVAGPVAGLVSDRLRNRWHVVRAGILLGVSGFVVLALVGHVWAVPVGVILVSASAGALATALAALVGDLAAIERQGVTMGALATAGDTGSALGPLVAYWLVVAVDLRWVYLLCALALGSGLIMTLGQGESR